MSDDIQVCGKCTDAHRQPHETPHWVTCGVNGYTHHEASLCMLQHNKRREAKTVSGTKPTCTAAELAEIRKITDEATTGEWEAQKPSWSRRGAPYKTAITAGNCGTVANAFTYCDHWYHGECPSPPSADAQFIAASRTAVPKLLDTIDELVSALKGCVGDCYQEGCPDCQRARDVLERMGLR